MGKRSRERREALQRGEGTRILNSAIGRRLVSAKVHGQVVQQLKAASDEEQLEALDLAASRKPSKIAKEIMKKAPGEMDKAIRKYKAIGRPITVETLTEEVRNTPSFLATCEKAGLSLAYFEKLAADRMAALGVE